MAEFRIVFLLVEAVDMPAVAVDAAVAGNLAEANRKVGLDRLLSLPR